MEGIIRLASRGIGFTAMLAVSAGLIVSVSLLMAARLLDYNEAARKSVLCAFALSKECIDARLEAADAKTEDALARLRASENEKAALERRIANLAELEKAFSNTVLFAEEPLPGVNGASVSTGVRYRSILDGQFSDAWCYLSVPKEGALSSNLNLANLSAGERIKWEDVSRKTLTAVSLGANDVKRARSLCRLPAD